MKRLENLSLYKEDIQRLQREYVNALSVSDLVSPKPPVIQHCIKHTLVTTPPVILFPI